MLGTKYRENGELLAAATPYRKAESWDEVCNSRSGCFEERFSHDSTLKCYTTIHAVSFPATLSTREEDGENAMLQSEQDCDWIPDSGRVAFCLFPLQMYDVLHPGYHPIDRSSATISQ
ncbi:hypothetical protein DPEC_G00360270 [Dallia pectoralis]|uniref:Uncharacterized protein n=1 Tax=Dallia pectoralis TaxID=75939 RepID=A0ACC2F0S8_DALPE|nr:hypothetical protein DPEC_G00360270 [Dallia pectoralis]